MRGITETTDFQWRIRQFMQAAGTVFNQIADYELRTWAVRYCIWLRDKHIDHVDVPAPGPTLTPRLRYYADQFTALAKEYLK